MPWTLGVVVNFLCYGEEFRDARRSTTTAK
jgi:hypothetical protein